MSQNDAFNTRQREHAGKLLVGYGDNIAGLLAEIEEQLGIVGADREAFPHPNEEWFTRLTEHLRRAAFAAYVIGHVVGGGDQREKMAGLSRLAKELPAIRAK